jgi:nicotinate phosphoribosyltransferase
MIKSLLDTDLYKFTMMQAVLHQFPGAMVEYRSKCRSLGVDLRPYRDEIWDAINHLCQLRFQPDELTYLRQFSFFKPDFVDFLRIFQLNIEYVQLACGNDLELTIKGPWLHTILFEVPLLAIISEVYFSHTQMGLDLAVGRARLEEKIDYINSRTDLKQSFIFSDFGTRRRFSRIWHEEVIKRIVEAVPKQFSGTSNVFLAKKLEVRPIGTMAHEYLQACQSLGPRLIYSQRFAFEKWAQEYRGELGIALSDVFGTKAFLADFDLYFCKLFDGARQDSGDPYQWGEQMIAHYERNRIDPKTKTLVFSDSLDFKLALDLCAYFKDRINPVFGIGTHLTNDVGCEALQIVIKMVACNGQPVAKVSDTPDKTMCGDPQYLAYVKSVFGIE